MKGQGHLVESTNILIVSANRVNIGAIPKV